MEIIKLMDLLISLEDLMIADTIEDRERNPDEKFRSELCNKLLDAHNFIMEKYNISKEDIFKYSDLKNKLNTFGKLKENLADSGDPYFSSRWLKKNFFGTDEDSDVPTTPQLY
jgi:hypothetical protein